MLVLSECLTDFPGYLENISLISLGTHDFKILCVLSKESLLDVGGEKIGQTDFVIDLLQSIMAFV